MTDIKKIKRERTKIYKKTRENMQKLSTWKDEFEPSVQRYAELRVQFENLTLRWYEEGCKITEEYTNKSGATNERKTALYLSLESLRRELLEMEHTFGLTPKGLRVIRNKGLEGTKESKLAAALHALEST